jgi:hypothetical protein
MVRKGPQRRAVDGILVGTSDGFTYPPLVVVVAEYNSQEGFTGRKEQFFGGFSCQKYH